ncbi:hypothetical protein DTO013E5_3873 [Penicillium roqueforti]|nr:hypothetical protein DTO012A1_684 [Penicillium roqueforti]KAI2755105.1 hypothetical protein DTO013F2_1597 [Penicillium roqueforti]KAI2772976.1 hypothetical protein DTO012A8_2615 [Penicillium roqueforti]KAI3081598.1 hypothetical protein CBS147339_2916 [Penicillium roqueforti]KAI3098336.1 hypothetical protein CBS147338_4282 [Penicillium roqueforti]
MRHRLCAYFGSLVVDWLHLGSSHRDLWTEFPVPRVVLSLFSKSISTWPTNVPATSLPLSRLPMATS